MKKLLLVLTVLLPMVANAYDVKIDGIYYNLSENEAIVTNNGANSYRGDITIPEQITSSGIIYTVTKIDEHAFENGSALLSINLPETIKEIGNYAFIGCSNLLSITIPGNVTSLGRGIFIGCSGLNSVTFSDGEEELQINQEEWKEHMFKDCSVSTIYLGRNIQDYTGSREFVSSPRDTHYGLFWSNALESLTISENVTKICYLAFAGCTNLNQLAISHSVIFFDQGAFADCISLTSLELDNPLCIIGSCAFWECSSLTDVTLNVMEIWNNAFDGCRSLKNVSLGKDVLSIGDDAFLECKEMENLYCYAVTPPATGSSVFKYSYYDSLKRLSWASYNQNVNLYVPNASINAYRGTEPWKSFRRITAIPVPVDGISMAENKTLYVGDKVKLQPQVLPSDATNQNVTWSSSNSEIVEVAEDGTILARAYGSAVITATTVDGGFTATCKVNVFEHTTGVQMIDNVSMIIGEQYELIAHTLPLSTSDGKIVYSNTNNNVVTVNENGLITALAKGTSTITATSVDGGHTATCVVTVTQPVAVTGIVLNSSSLQFDYIGETANLEATVLPENAANKKVNWTSSNPSVCIVSNGMVVSVGMGTSVVIATTEDGGFMAVCVVTVTSATGISSVEQNDGMMFQIYDINGLKQKQLQKGINIIQFKDGSRRKVLIK